MVDVGQIFGDNVEAAAARLPALEQVGADCLRSRSIPARFMLMHRSREERE
jgi:hypothetical protein